MMWKKTGLALLGLLLVGCGAPAGFEPLDLSPPAAERGLWRYEGSGYQRYDGHANGRVYVLEDGETRDLEIEEDTQDAGDFETRARTFTRADGLTVEVVAVTPLAEPAYFESVTAQVASADAVLAAVPVSGDERLGKLPEEVVAARVLRGVMEALDLRLVFVGQALRATDQRWAHPRVDEKVLARRRAVMPSETQVDKALEGLRELVADYGADVVIHYLVMARVSPPMEVNHARRGPIGEEGFALEPPAPAGTPTGADDVTDDFVWEARTLRDACLSSLEPLLTQGGARRIAVLAPPVTCRALAGALQAQGFVCSEERWLRAIRLAR
jgi:hypothetical protein